MHTWRTKHDFDQNIFITYLVTFVCYLIHSYLFPDGRSYNPDLTGLCEPTPQDHIKVTQVGVCVWVWKHALSG